VKKISVKTKYDDDHRWNRFPVDPGDGFFHLQAKRDTATGDQADGIRCRSCGVKAAAAYERFGDHTYGARTYRGSHAW
jgi:hypothetical protein